MTREIYYLINLVNFRSEGVGILSDRHGWRGVNSMDGGGVNSMTSGSSYG